MSSEESDSSSDEDMPLSSLVKNSRSSSRASRGSYKEESAEEEEELEFDDGVESDEGDDDDDGESSDDDAPLSEFKSPKANGESSDDDAPLSEFKSPKAKTAAKKKATKKKATKKKATKKKATKKKSTPKKKTVVKKFESSTKAMISRSSELYLNAKKGKLISELLSRWWYTITWPEPESLPESVPVNCDAMDGFKGVYVTTSGEDVGKILDMRNKDTCPNFINMAKKDSAELQELLLKAIAEQRRQLIEADGEGTQTEKDLGMLEKWAKKVNPKTADKEAIKVLKAVGLYA